MASNHFNDQGAARMVDVSGKASTLRVAVAEAGLQMQASTVRMILDHGHAKGDVLGIARIAAITATKQTQHLIPLCHAILIESVDVEFENPSETLVVCRVTVRTSGKTGVEMEAMTGAAIGALTVYDMCKSVDRAIEVIRVRLLEKSGGASGQYRCSPSS